MALANVPQCRTPQQEVCSILNLHLTQVGDLEPWPFLYLDCKVCNIKHPHSNLALDLTLKPSWIDPFTLNQTAAGLLKLRLSLDMTLIYVKPFFCASRRYFSSQ